MITSHSAYNAAPVQGGSFRPPQPSNITPVSNPSSEEIYKNIEEQLKLKYGIKDSEIARVSENNNSENLSTYNQYKHEKLVKLAESLVSDEINAETFKNIYQYIK